MRTWIIMEFINVIAVVSIRIMNGMWSNFELWGVIVKFIIFRKENRLIIKYLPIYRRKSSYLVSFPENELSIEPTICIYFVYHCDPWNNKNENDSKKTIIMDYRQFLFILEVSRISIELYETFKNSCWELCVNVNNTRIITNKIRTSITRSVAFYCTIQ